MMGRFVMVFLSVVIGLAPLALGSNRALPWALNAVFAGAIAVLCCGVVWSERHNRTSLSFGLVGFPLILWALALLWALVQLLPLGGTGLVHPSWSLALPVLGNDLSGAITVNRHETAASIMRFLTYSAIFLAAFVLGRDSARAGYLLRAFTVAAALYAVYGLLRFGTGIDKLLWFDQPSDSTLSSTFVNRNSAATYFGMAACVAFSFLLRRARHAMQEADRESTAREGLERVLNAFSGWLGLELALFVLLLTATLLTQSRAGVAATVVALGFGLLQQRLRLGRGGKARGALAVIVIGAVATLAVLQMSGASVMERLAGTGIESEGRLDAFADTAAAISDHLWLGSGLGTFQDIFPLYRNATQASTSIWDKAHNDYLEILLGLGLPAGLAIILSIAALVSRCVRGVFDRRRNSHIPAAGAMAGVLIAIHAMFDFSMQIQAVAGSLAMILGVAVAQSKSDRTH